MESLIELHPESTDGLTLMSLFMDKYTSANWDLFY